MPDESAHAVPVEPYLALALDRAEARHLLRALTRASVYAVHVSEPDERHKARADADAYELLRNRLLLDVVHRDLELDLDDPDD